jgi:hypothetical protein
MRLDGPLRNSMANQIPGCDSSCQIGLPELPRLETLMKSEGDLQRLDRSATKCLGKLAIRFLLKNGSHHVGLRIIGIGLAPIPEGFVAPWWLYPKDQWPYETIPWGDKIFGAFSARKIMMYSKNPDPPGELQSHPPFGTIKVTTPTQPSPNALTPIKIHMRPEIWLDTTPPPYMWEKAKLEEALRVMSRTRPIRLRTESGSITIKAIRSAPWNQHKPKTSPKPPPTHDLFQ